MLPPPQELAAELKHRFALVLPSLLIAYPQQAWDSSLFHCLTLAAGVRMSKFS